MFSTTSETKDESNLPKQGLSFLIRYPAQELYRLVVDSVFHQSQKG
jgi:hypothetical protein